MEFIPTLPHVQLGTIPAFGVIFNPLHAVKGVLIPFSQAFFTLGEKAGEEAGALTI